MPLLEVSDLHIALPTAQGMVDVVRGVGFSLERGQTLGLVGESGGGKSLMALALLGLLPEGAKARGSIRLNGKELLGLPEASLRPVRGLNMGMVLQEPLTTLDPKRCIGDQVMEPLRLHSKLGRSASRQQAQVLLRRVGIQDSTRCMEAFAHQFSAGQRQRITLAIALACGPALLIADEPAPALDPILRQKMLEVLWDLNVERQRGLLLISRDLGLIAENTDHLLVMYGGMVLESGPTPALFSDAAHPYTRGLLAARPVLSSKNRLRQALPAIAGAAPALGQFSAGCPFAGRCEFTLAACQHAPPAAQTLSKDGDSDGVYSAHSVRCVRIQAVPDAAPGQAHWKLR